jgi:hypothetical protein
MIPVFKAKKTGGALKLADKPRFSTYLRTLPDGEIEVIVRRISKTRSKRQNSYYWGVVLQIISDITGNSTEEVHEILKFHVFRIFLTKWITFNDEEIEVVRSTTDLNTVEMEDYLSKIRQWAAQELQAYIPLPNEVVNE